MQNQNKTSFLIKDILGEEESSEKFGDYFTHSLLIDILIFPALSLV